MDVIDQINQRYSIDHLPKKSKEMLDRLYKVTFRVNMYFRIEAQIN